MGLEKCQLKNLKKNVDRYLQPVLVLSLLLARLLLVLLLPAFIVCFKQVKIIKCQSKDLQNVSTCRACLQQIVTGNSEITTKTANHLKPSETSQNHRKQPRNHSTPPRNNLKPSKITCN